MQRKKEHGNVRKLVKLILLLQMVCMIEVTSVLKMTLLDTGAYNEYKAGYGANMYNSNRDANTDKDTSIITMTGLSQAHIPTGCESVSTVTVLNYFGIEITPEAFIEDYLTCEPFYRENGVLCGPNPHEAFAGNPFQKASLGCFPRVIVQALENMRTQEYEGMEEITFADVSGTGLEQLEEEYLKKGIPVLLWVTMEMKPSYAGMQYYLEDGSCYIWRAGEHCMVLCGYDENSYYLIDPLAGGEVVCYTRELVESRYEEMGEYAVVIVRIASH